MLAQRGSTAVITFHRVQRVFADIKTNTIVDQACDSSVMLTACKQQPDTRPKGYDFDIDSIGTAIVFDQIVGDAQDARLDFGIDVRFESRRSRRRWMERVQLID